MQWKEHLLNLCGRDEALARYNEALYAHLIQQPRGHRSTGVIFSAPPGAGKNLFLEFFMHHVIGRNNVAVCSDITHLLNKFNAGYVGKLFILCDEMSSFGGSKGAADLLKSKITQTMARVEPKGREAYEVPDYTRYCFLTNHEWVVRVEKGCRRYVNCRTEIVPDRHYFDEIAVPLLTSREAGREVFQYLAHLDISGVNLARVPETEARQIALENDSQADPILYLRDFLKNPRAVDGPVGLEIEAPDPNQSASALYSRYLDWHRGTGRQSKAYTSTAFGRALNTLGIPKRRTVRGACYTVTEQTVKEAWINHFGEGGRDRFDGDYVGE